MPTPEDPAKLSGAAWVAKFPSSTSLSDLISPFRDRISSFLSALSGAGANYYISATRRPPQRAYLMHFSWRIAREGLDPSSVPSMSGVDIVWTHATLSQSVAAAQAMVAGYQIVYRPALVSDHTAGRAIDTTISNLPAKITINGTDVDLSSTTNAAQNAQLHAAAWKYFKVRKLLGDPPHWYSNPGD
ncbi:hypothetical protein HFO62_32525 [Rhizobium leguminosarum]|nr:hypothetical protein [Rhizobium leguminosarum]